MLEYVDLSWLQFSIIAGCALLVGMSKAGLPGVSIVAIPALAWIFGGKQSTGILLPILIFADLFGVAYYHRHANWKYVTKALPWAFAGILLGMVVGNMVNDKQFKHIIAIAIITSLGIMLLRDYRKKNEEVPSGWAFAAFLGLAGGFATMIGNAAGPIFAIYLLAMRLPKNVYIGTSAWFFLMINLFKVPLHIFSWKTITLHTFTLDLLTLPFVAAGAFLGIWIVKKIPNHIYRWFVMVAIILSSLMLLR